MEPEESECPECNGTGACQFCGGSGEDEGLEDGQCGECDGSGDCDACGGTGKI